MVVRSSISTGISDSIPRGDALGHLLQQLSEAGVPVAELGGTRAHGRRQEEFAARHERHLGDLAGERPLVGDRERADLVDLVAEELDAVRMIGDGREHVEDATPHGELVAPARDHVDTVVGQLHQPRDHRIELAPATTDTQFDRLDGTESGSQRLQGASDRSGDDEGRDAVPRRDAAQHVEPAADRLGTGAQALVGQRLPGREVQHLRTGHYGIQGRTQRLGSATGRRDDENGTRAPPSDGARGGGDDGSIQPVDDRERQIGGGRRSGVPVRLSLLEGRERSRELSLDPSYAGAPTPAPMRATAEGARAHAGRRHGPFVDGGSASYSGFMSRPMPPAVRSSRLLTRLPRPAQC